MRVEVLEPGDKKPRGTGRFGSNGTFKEKTSITYTFRIYFAPPKLKGTVPSDALPGMADLGDATGAVPGLRIIRLPGLARTAWRSRTTTWPLKVTS